MPILDGKDYYELGFDGHIGKPFEVNALYIMLADKLI